MYSTEGVGKSSLISTFVSRCFADVVPSVMTRVRLPPDPQNNNCVTTIVDSQSGDAALLQYNNESHPQKNWMETIDSIILVYDLDRSETFFRLENHWLPLIQKCYQSKVCNFV